MDKKKKFLQEYKITRDIKKSCLLTPICRKTYTRWIDSDAAFRDAIDAINIKEEKITCQYNPDIDGQKALLRAALKAQGKMGIMIEPQIEAAALSWCQMMRIAHAISETDYQILVEVISREGHVSRKLNPLEDLFVKCREEYNKELQACGLNFGSAAFAMDSVDNNESDYDKRRAARRAAIAASIES